MSESAVEKQLMAILWQHLAALRAARGLTQDDVANAAGMSKNHYQLLESGWSNRETKSPANPTMLTLIKVSEALGTTVPDLVAVLFNRTRPDTEGRGGSTARGRSAGPNPG